MLNHLLSLKEERKSREARTLARVEEHLAGFKLTTSAPRPAIEVA
jgi:hypothetical protein